MHRKQASVYELAQTLPSAAGLLIAAADLERRAEFRLDSRSRVLLIATEGPVPEA